MIPASLGQINMRLVKHWLRSCGLLAERGRLATGFDCVKLESS